MATMREQLAARRAELEAGTAKEDFQLSESENTAPEDSIPEEVNDDEVVGDEPVEGEPKEEVAADSEVDPAKQPLEAVAQAGATEKGAEDFKPDFKYRSDGKDMEVPEYLRPFIKDKDTQEKVIKMLEKYDAFDTVSSRRDQFRMERDAERQEKQRFVGAVENLRQTVQRGDIDGFLKMVELPEEAILKWATEKAKYYMGDENYRQQVDQQMRQRQESWSKEAQVNDYQAKYQDLEVRQLQTEFNYEMMKPEVSSFSASFDKMAGKPGAFIEEIKNRGELAYLRERKTIPPGEVIQGIMRQFSTITQAAQQPSLPATTTAANKVIVKAGTKAPTIPTVKGSSASPTQEGFTSLDKIRSYRKEKYGK